MGVKRLKIKQNLNYRNGYTHSHCSDCNDYVHNFEIPAGGFEPRCKLIGLEPGRMFRINPNHICDRFDNSDLLKRVRGY